MLQTCMEESGRFTLPEFTILFYKYKHSDYYENLDWRKKGFYLGIFFLISI